MAVFKVRVFQCGSCRESVKGLRWDTDAAPECPVHKRPMHEDVPWCERAPAAIQDTVDWRPCETLGHDVFWYNSKTALRAEAERRGAVNVVRHDDAYYAKQRKMHDECLRDTGKAPA